MKKCCNWCHKLYDTEDNYIHIRMFCEEHVVNNIVLKGKRLDVCKDCIRAFVNGYSVDNNDIELVD